MPDTLKPCRCGGKAELKDKCLIEHCGWGKSFLVFWVECPECGEETEHFREEPKKAIDAWNRRVCDERVAQD